MNKLEDIDMSVNKWKIMTHFEWHTGDCYSVEDVYQTQDDALDGLEKEYRNVLNTLKKRGLRAIDRGIKDGYIWILTLNDDFIEIMVDKITDVMDKKRKEKFWYS